MCLQALRVPFTSGRFNEGATPNLCLVCSCYQIKRTNIITQNHTYFPVLERKKRIINASLQSKNLCFLQLCTYQVPSDDISSDFSDDDISSDDIIF